MPESVRLTSAADEFDCGQLAPVRRLPGIDKIQVVPGRGVRGAAPGYRRTVQRTIVVVGYPGAELLDVAALTTTFDYANRAGASPRYQVRTVAPGAAPIVTQSGLVLQPQGSLERLRGPVDTLIVSGGEGHLAAAADAALVGHVRRVARESRRIASVCTGASVLAATGLLDGRRVTTHWLWAEQLAVAYPALRVDPAPIWIRDGAVTTAAGVTSALDLALAFVAEDHGPEPARLVARGLVTYLQRPGDQAQMSLHLAAPVPRHRVMRDLLTLIAADPGGDLGVAALAARAGVSERHLTRLFRVHLGQSPARYVRAARLEAAAHLLRASELPVDRVAERCGFASAETLRLAFLDRHGLTPAQFRARGAAQPNAATSTTPSPAGTSSTTQNSASDRGTT
jgi:transcriptional regulator GlxA family with amidase domain